MIFPAHSPSRAVSSIVRNPNLLDSRSAASGNAMKRIWTIIGVSDVPGELQMVSGSSSAKPRRVRTMTTLVRSLMRTELFCSACIKWGAHEHPSLTSPSDADTRQRAPPVLPCRRLRGGPEQSSRSRSAVRRGTPSRTRTLKRESSPPRDPDGYYVTISADG